MVAGDLILDWIGLAGRRYQFERAQSLSDPNAFVAVTKAISGLTGLNRFVHNGSAQGGPWFYRMRVEPD